jgi:transcriptional regulator GlxA family with amidase domain
MKSNPPKFDITIPIYEGVDLMDVAAPVEFFSWMASNWTEKKATISLAATTLKKVKTRDGLKLTPDRTFADYTKNNIQIDLIWVPGGAPTSLEILMKGGKYLDFITEQSKNAEYVTSVCEGAMLLAAAGLLDGYQATTHWAFIPCLKTFPKIKVVDGYPRYVVDGNRITGGGISSGLDEALKIISIIAGDEIAMQTQLTTQYFPKPPFNPTIPSDNNCPLNLEKTNIGQKKS